MLVTGSVSFGIASVLATTSAEVATSDGADSSPFSSVAKPEKLSGFIVSRNSYAQIYTIYRFSVY